MQEGKRDHSSLILTCAKYVKKAWMMVAKGLGEGPKCVLGNLKAEWFYSGAGKGLPFALMRNDVCG
jgi:hypothetical protein